jgi:hypothetical protein
MVIFDCNVASTRKTMEYVVEVPRVLLVVLMPKVRGNEQKVSHILSWTKLMLDLEMLAVSSSPAKSVST